MKTYITVTIDKLILGGQGLGRLDNKIVLVWNALPGEKVKAFIIRKRKNLIEAMTEEVLIASPHRVVSQEDHFLSCSPWQTLSWEQEQYWKQEMVKETFQRIAKIEIKNIDIRGEESAMYGYRNKMEHSFKEVEGQLHLAVFKRGSHWLQSIDTCRLSDEAIQRTEQRVLEYLRSKNKKASSLKTLLTRSNGKGQTLVGIFSTEKTNQGYEDLDRLLNETIIGVQLYYSDPRSPASISTKLISRVGRDTLQADVLGTLLSFGLFSFFQVNIPLFEKALQDIALFLDKDTDLVDFYAGVGAISLSLRQGYRQAILVESIREATDFAQHNATDLGIQAQIICAQTQDMLKYITHDKIVVFDPPRPGLHPDVIKKTLETLPKRIIYLACDVATQARDIGLLQEKYQLVFTKLYNFFPRTPHIESLCVLERR